MKSRSKHWQKLGTLIVVGGLMFFTITAAAAGTIAYEQSPGHFGGFLSDGQVFAVADEFQLDQSQLISEITWWGGYASTNLPAPSSDNFTIRLFADTGEAPGTLLQSFNVGNNALRTDTGDFVNPPDPFSGFEGRPEFKYSFNLPTVFPADANTRYWLSIINAPSSDSWVWEVSDSLVNLGVQRSFEGGPWEPFFDNTAFQLQAVGDTRPLSVNIDIKPDGSPNSINLSNQGVIPVAILSSSTFNAASQVDKTSLTFGRTGDEPSLVSCSSKPVDVNRDGLLDLVCTFNTPTTGFQPGDTVGSLKGTTFTGDSISGTDSIRIVP
jgi:hypothetical protein